MAIQLIFRFPEVMVLTSLSRASITRMVAAGTFPKPIKLGRVYAWRRCDLEVWLGQSIPTSSDAEAA